MILLALIALTSYAGVKGDVINNTFGYPQCQGMAYEFDGYTYMHIPYSNTRLWNQCAFPNPLHDHKLCGRPEINGRHYFCDPDKLMESEKPGAVIDGQLKELQRRTSTLCVNTNGEHESFIVAVAIIDRILIPDLNSSQLCSNECGRLEPYLDLTQSYPSFTEQQEIMRNFADNLRQKWSLGFCDNEVVIFYCREFNMVHISAGLKASQYLTKAVTDDLQDTFITYINVEGLQTGLELGLVHMISTLRTALRGFTYAHVIIIIHACTLLIVGVLLFLYFGVRKVDSDVWGYTYPWVITDWVLQFISGIWFVKAMITSMAFMSHHEKGDGLLWALGAACGATFLCFLLYFISLEF
ncbi:uncharacterized protein LOC132760550 [Ruditapes philippinarum]|uniref:uncharacterized protein LOC132760550 n=1 Tax=Ruditapes philippinarum TaxID=129788 RepID=UPI00295A8962|nr:uncharacterized protein LOC132760550 [Ruditapes philippinarum]XP_060608526.1 uncharacterized protein LOC132760550 [Ruditapes philippinarum]